MPFSGGLKDTFLQEMQPGGDLQSNGLQPELDFGDQVAAWSHLWGEGCIGGEGSGNKGLTLPQDGLMVSAAKWADSNWSIGEPNLA